MLEINSQTNPKLKQVRALRQRKHRDATSLYVVEGIHHVGEAVEAGAPLEYLCWSPEMLSSPFARELVNQQEARGVACYSMSADIFKSIADKDNPQGLLAVARQRHTPLDDLIPETNPWCVALVTPQDPGNVGAILRTMDAVGANGLIILDGGADPYHPGAVRASMGAMFSQLLASTTFMYFVGWVREHGYHVYGTSAHGSVGYRQANYARPAVLLLGSEQRGLAPKQLETCEQVVRLPMKGRVTSLNLAVAAGVMLYAMLGE
jgi:TrmH family RNA methyltransferase